PAATVAVVMRRRTNDFLTGQNGSYMVTQLFDGAGVSPGQTSLLEFVDSPPAVLALPAEIPGLADAQGGRFVVGVMEEDGQLSRLGPIEDRPRAAGTGVLLRTRRVRDVPRDVLPNSVAGVLALQVLHLGVDDDLLLLAHLVHAQQHDVGAVVLHQPAQRRRAVDIA